MNMIEAIGLTEEFYRGKHDPYIVPLRPRMRGWWDLQEILNKESSRRETALLMYAMDYFRRRGVEEPLEFYDRPEIVPLMDDQQNTNIRMVAKHLRSLKTWARTYHHSHVTRIPIENDITKQTIKKAIRLTRLGPQIENMGVGRGTTANLGEGFITIPALEHLIFRLFGADRIPEDVLIYFGDKNLYKPTEETERLEEALKTPRVKNNPKLKNRLLRKCLETTKDSKRVEKAERKCRFIAKKLAELIVEHDYPERMQEVSDDTSGHR